MHVLGTFCPPKILPFLGAIQQRIDVDDDDEREFASQPSLTFSKLTFTSTTISTSPPLYLIVAVSRYQFHCSSARERHLCQQSTSYFLACKNGVSFQFRICGEQYWKHQAESLRRIAQQCSKAHRQSGWRSESRGAWHIASSSWRNVWTGCCFWRTWAARCITVCIWRGLSASFWRINTFVWRQHWECTVCWRLFFRSNSSCYDHEC